MVTAYPNATVRFESYGVAPDLWGATQANFMVAVPGRHAIETAVMLNDPAATFLASELAADASEAFRQEMARTIGQLWLESAIARGGHVAPAITVSRATLQAEPWLVEKLRAARSS